MKNTIRRSQLVPAIVALAALLAIGAWLILGYVQKEKERDLHGWRTLLGTVADSRSQNIGQWLDAQMAVIREIAENASVRFYLTQYTATPDGGSFTPPAQAGYLRNLLEATAERSHFAGTPNQARIPANIDLPVDSGLVIVDQEGKPIAETSGFRTDDTLRATLLEVIKSGKPGLQDLYTNARGEAVIGFVMPIFHVQFGGGKQALGAVAGVKRARDGLFPLIAHKGTLTSADETVLIRREGDNISYLTPLADGTHPLRKRLPVTEDLAGSFALTQPGMFGVKKDYTGREVLMTSRTLTQTPWTLVQKVDASEALKESREHQRFLLTSLFLSVLVGLAALIAAWWHGASVKERTVSEEMRAKSRELARQSALLQSVMDGTPDLVFILSDQHLDFCNAALCRAIGEKPTALAGKTLSSILGPAAAHPIEAIITGAQSSGKAASRMTDIEIGERSGIYYVSVIPIEKGGDKRQVLCICRDMTREQEAQSKRQALMNKLVTVLTEAVDQHDPFCAEHSGRTAQVAVALGKALAIDAATLEALDMAAKLANVGKMFLPRDLLTKHDPLTAEEQALLQTHVKHSVEVLKGLDFEGPVATIVAQKSEHVDGSGYPKGLKGEELLPASRILAVANAFVAMVSARAYRAGLPLKDALDKLLVEADSKYDRHVVGALFHIAQNRHEWDSWSSPREDKG